MADQVSVLVEGGKATPGNPLGPALGPLGVNVVQVVQQINEKTKAFAGMKVPVVVKVASDKSVTVEVGRPGTAALLLAEIKKEKGSGKAKTESVGDVTLEQISRVATMKEADLFGASAWERENQVLGTCVSMGITVGGRDPRELLKERRAARSGTSG
jgi:large subunit ribosomal protein L11